MSAMIGNPLLLGGGDYEISRSVRLRSSASGYFNRTPGSAGDNQKWTWSGWIKLGNLSTASLFSAQHSSGTDASVYTAIYYINNRLELQRWNGATYQIQVASNNLLRDPSAWYHFVVTVDTPQATAANRVKLYINGTETSYSTATYPSQNFGTDINATQRHALGALVRLSPNNFSGFFDGYLTEINFIDGQALTPSSFGESNSTTGVWQPKKYTGTYGTNGFYLNFSDNSNNTAATIGKDYSGNGNNWTPNNISVTSGATYDSMLDVPTPWADGGNGRGNYAVLNPLQSAVAPTAGNLDFSSGGGETCPKATIQLPLTGKWYWETYCSQTGTDNYIGVTTNQTGLSFTGTYRAYRKTGVKDTNGTTSAYGASWASGDTLAVAVDMDAGTIVFYKNGTSQGTAFSDLAGTAWTVFFYGFINAGHQVNFGQRPFSYTPPSGFKALNTLNLPEPTIKKGNLYFDATLWTGNGTSQTITNSGAMQPDFVWAKKRNSTSFSSHQLVDAVRGTSAYLFTDSTSAEVTATDRVIAFNANGFSVSSASQVNGNADTFVGWQWKEGATQGFDIVTYTGSASAQNISHSLGVAPRMIIVKTRGTPNGSARDWLVWHSTFTSTEYIFLNQTAAKSSASGSLYWNSTLPTSTQFSVGTDPAVNWASTNYVAYLFAEVAGFSRFGSYTGNGSTDGPFVFCGFRPAFLMIKRTDSTGSWFMNDDARTGYNVNTFDLQANSSGAESSNSICDFTANGFKIRIDGLQVNASGGTFVFMAFAENPFKNALAR